MGGRGTARPNGRPEGGEHGAERHLHNLPHTVLLLELPRPVHPPLELPGRYIRHYNYRLHVQPADTKAAKPDATFYAE
ncbi:AbfB domain-containing protein [Streptomyces sp. NPDC012616]|uniref:AbfB domain-containing protein n=1 Tax=Streptomyces sp. NPDC012616 TaxID=3364840 RepID=UPI0036E013F9